MASSTQASGADGGNPTRHTGRGFALKDPERQREVPQQTARPHGERQALPGTQRQAGREAAAADGGRRQHRNAGD